MMENKIWNVVIVLLVLANVTTVAFIVSVSTRPKRYIVACGSDSMWEMECNQTVLCDENRQPVIGDIVVYKRNDTLISHTVMKDNGTHFVTKGSNNNYYDVPILYDKVRCVVMDVVAEEVSVASESDVVAVIAKKE